MALSSEPIKRDAASSLADHFWLETIRGGGRQLTLGTELKGQPAKCLERALDTAVCLRTITAPAPPGAGSLLRHLQEGGGVEMIVPV